MSQQTTSYELERDKTEGNEYFVYKNFEGGVHLLWKRFLLRQQAVKFIKHEAMREGVQYFIRPGVFRRNV